MIGLTAQGAQDARWQPTVDGMVLMPGGHYAIGDGHTVKVPIMPEGFWVRLKPGNGNWRTLTATIETVDPFWTVGPIILVENDSIVTLTSEPNTRNFRPTQG